jgi:hypothetical protein
MSTVRRLVAEERGLVGKAFFITLFVAVILLIGALDVLSITVAHYHTADVAQSAAFDAAQSYKDSGSIQQACDVALVDDRGFDRLALEPGGKLGLFGESVAWTPYRAFAQGRETRLRRCLEMLAI